MEDRIRRTSNWRNNIYGDSKKARIFIGVIGADGITTSSIAKIPVYVIGFINRRGKIVKKYICRSTAIKSTGRNNDQSQEPDNKGLFS